MPTTAATWGLNLRFCRREKRRRPAAQIPPSHQQGVSHGLPRRRVSAGMRNENTRAATPAAPMPPHAVAAMLHTALLRRRTNKGKRLLERVLKLRQREALLLLDDGLLFHNLDIHCIAPEPLDDVLVDPRRRR